MGGGERYMETLVRGLKKKGWDFTLVSSSKALLSVFKKNAWPSHAVFGGFEPVTKLGVVLFMVTAPVFLLLHALLLVWFRFVRKTETIICLSMTEKLLVTPMATALKMRVIWMEHLLPGRAVTMNPYRNLLLRHAAEADIVTVSETAERALTEAGYPENRIRIISPGARIPARPSGPNDAPIIGFVARLHREKGVMSLIDAFTEVVKHVPDARLEIYGEGEERELLEKTVAMRLLDSRVTFHGWIDSREGFSRGFRLLAVPSEKESFGMAALEAMAEGLPVVGTRVGGLSEVIEDKVTGLLVPSGDPEALAATIVRLLEDPALCRTLGEAGYARAKDRYSNERFLSAWHALLNG
jgi:glycosyltransferase involved in cell wall biosynthesis